MPITTNGTSKANLLEHVKETWVERKWFIFTWHELARSDKIGNDLFIETDELIDRVFINGKEITWK